MLHKLHTSEQVVNVQGATSVGLAITSWVVDMEPVLQVLATAVAIVVGIVNVWWVIEKARLTRWERKEHEAEKDGQH